MMHRWTSTIGTAVLMVQLIACSRSKTRGALEPEPSNSRREVTTNSSNGRDERTRPMLEIPVPKSDAEVIRVRDMNARIAFILAMVQYWDSTKGIAMPFGSLPSQIKADITGWHGTFFKDSCRLFEKESSCRVVLGEGDKREDVVIRDFASEGQVVTTYETSRQVALLLPMREARPNDGESLRLALTKLAANCVHGDLEGEVALTTDPYQLIWTAPFWHSRVDAGTLAGRIFVLLYKRVNQLVGFADGLWFDDKSRAAVKTLGASKR